MHYDNRAIPEIILDTTDLAHVHYSDVTLNVFLSQRSWAVAPAQQVIILWLLKTQCFRLHKFVPEYQEATTLLNLGRSGFGQCLDGCSYGHHMYSPLDDGR